MENVNKIEKPHKKLDVWNKSMDLTKEVYELTSTFPQKEQYGLVSQMRRAAASIPLNIAEGAARQTKKEFLQFVYIAKGSLSELDTCIELAIRLGYLKSENLGKVLSLVRAVDMMLSGLVRSLSSNVSRFPFSVSRGQATTEMVLLVPLFLILAIGIVKIFALAVMVQKMELACYYAGRRWMLESHKNAAYASWDQNTLVKDIERWVAEYLGAGDETKEKLLGFTRQDIRFKVEPTIIYGVLTLKVRTVGLIPFRPDLEKEWEIIKYVPTRDRPIQWNVPSVSGGGE